MSITRENARKHCRTCLCSLGRFEYSSEDRIPSKRTTTDEAIIRHAVATHLIKDLQGLNEELVNKVPKRLCPPCHSTLQGFVNFRQTAIESTDKLNAIFSVGVVAADMTFDFAETSSQGDISQETLNNVDIYGSRVSLEMCADYRETFLQLKNALMETESVLLEDVTDPPLGSEESRSPLKGDPFETTVSCVQSSLTAQNSNYGASDRSHHSDIESLPELAATNTDRAREKKDSTNNNALAVPGPRVKGITTAKAKRKAIREKCVRKPNLNDPPAESPEKEEVPKSPERRRRRIKRIKKTFKCDQCRAAFAHKITHDAHVRKVHEENKRPYECDRCDKAYRYFGGLYTHIKEIHQSAGRSYKCENAGCGRVYTSLVAMHKHKRTKHTDADTHKQFVCEQCGATFNQTSNLKYHRRKHHPTEAERAKLEKMKEERYECTICKKIFHSRYTLNYHTLQLHTHDRRFECSVCGRRMAKKFMLLQHMVIHSTEKMPCEHCGKQFIRKFELEAHIRAVHMKLKPFECQYCAECFASRKTLQHHVYIHTGEKPYVCDVCGQAYRQQTCLKNHRKSHEVEPGSSMMKLRAKVAKKVYDDDDGSGCDALNESPPTVKPPVKKSVREFYE